MKTLYMFLTMSLSVSALIYIISLKTSKKSIKTRELSSPFECGFEPIKTARSPFSLRFFLLTVIFLVFDVELALLFPLSILTQSYPMNYLASAIFSISILLLLGLLYEWMNGSLSWL